MPLIDGSDFEPNRAYRHAHYSTYVPSLFGHQPKLGYQRKRINTPDDDFIDLDIIDHKCPRVALLCHGLEGDSGSTYVLLTAQALAAQGWDIIALNYRSCSEEMNRSFRTYNSGYTEDLRLVIDEYCYQWQEILLVGFSLGGNLVLKYAGERDGIINDRISSIIAISTPLDLDDASRELLRWDNFGYQVFFLKSLMQKIILKQKQYPDQLSLKHLRKCYNLYRFDEYYTAPMWGYDSAKDYYDQCSSLQWLDQIQAPSLIINAENDPFLGKRSYPIDLATSLSNIHLCIPKYGGHVGFAYSKDDRSWMLDKITDFANEKSITRGNTLGIAD